MGIFDLLKKKNQSVVWRDSNGIIKCLGDDCHQQECDDTCPIWCNTMGLTMAQMGQIDNAISQLKKALTLAPDFKDAWANLATMYGSIDNHLEAYKAYKAAYDIDNNYKNAIWGLIVSHKNLKQFEESLRYCDEYAQKISKTEAESLRVKVIEAQKSGNVSKCDSATNMALSIIAHARSYGLLGANDNFPHIPEIMIQSKSVCHKIFQNLINDGAKEGKYPVVWLIWGAYAGIGAVYHWTIDWDELKEKGVAETLLEPRGVFAMDEYVSDTIGITFDSPEGERFACEIKDLAKWAFNKFVNNATNDNAMNVTMECMQAMYLFGMVYEMERLGMR